MVESLSDIQLYRYSLPNGWIILAGKTDSDNDVLSLKIARQNDYWFHVKGMPGSHVVLQSDGQLTPDKNTLKIAAAVAAWHSKARNGGTVAVSCTQAKYVSKPKKAGPGTVHIRNERTLMVKPALPQTKETP